MANTFNPFVDPATQAQIDRQRQFAQLLQQQSLEEPQGQMVSGRYVAPSITQNLSRLLQGYQAKKLNEQTDQQQSGLWQNQMGNIAQILGGSGTGVGQSPRGIQDSGQLPDMSMGGMSPSGNNFNLANLLRSQAIGAVGGDPASSAYWKQFEPTDASKMALAAGLDPRIANQQALQKATYIAPTRLGEGAYADSNGAVQGLPTQAPPGFINQRNPQTGQWETVPVGNGMQAIEQSTGAKTAAESANKIINVKQASGAEIPMWAGSVAGQAPMQAIPQGQAQPPTANFDLSTPQKVLQAQQDIEKLKLSDPQQAQAIQQALDDQKFASIPKLQTPNGVGQSTYNETTQKAQGEAASKLQEKYGTLADAANKKIALNNQALDLVNKSDLGPGASMTADLKSIIAKYVPGVSEASFQNTPSATLSLQKDLLNAATAKAKAQFGSRITQQEVQLMLSKGSPNVNMPKAAIQYLIQSDNATSNYDIQQAQDFGKYLQNGGDPYQFEGWYAKNFPLTDQTGQVHLQSTPKPSYSPQQVMDELRRRGLAK